DAYRASTRTNSATCSVLSPSITTPSRCSRVQLVPPGSSTTALPPSSYTPTCIEARVLKLGLKKTSATLRPASGFDASSPRLKRSAASSRPSSSSRVQSAVVRKFLGIVTHRFLSAPPQTPLPHPSSDKAAAVDEARARRSTCP